jgi:hypothetical protein
MGSESSPYRVQDDVPAYGCKIPISLHDLRFEPSLEHMTAPTMPEVPPLRVDAIDVLDRHRQIRMRCYDDEMIVIRHEAECVADNAVPAKADIEQLEQLLVVPLVEEDEGFRVAPRHDVVAGAREQDAEWSCHAGRKRQGSFHPVFLENMGPVAEILSSRLVGGKTYNATTTWTLQNLQPD